MGKIILFLTALIFTFGKKLTLLASTISLEQDDQYLDFLGNIHPQFEIGPQNSGYIGDSENSDEMESIAELDSSEWLDGEIYSVVFDYPAFIKNVRCLPGDVLEIGYIAVIASKYHRPGPINQQNLDSEELIARMVRKGQIISVNIKPGMIVKSQTELFRYIDISDLSQSEIYEYLQGHLQKRFDDSNQTPMDIWY